MKSNIIVVICFVAGIACGVFFGDTLMKYIEGIPIYILYALLFQVGLNLGANTELGSLKQSMSPITLMLPVFTMVGTLLFTALGGFLLSSWSSFDCMAVGCGFGYYSLSSILIMQLKEVSSGIEIASQLGAIALLANVMREILGMLGAPLYVSLFGKFASVSAAGSPSMDVCLPMISRYSGEKFVPIAIIHGIVLDMSVPILVPLLCQ